MFIKKSFFFAVLLFINTALQSQSPADYVNPFIGTSNYGATHPGPQYPGGLASITPFNVAYRLGTDNPFEKDKGWNSRSYIHENGYLTGYAHTNLSGVGCPDLGAILLMPTTDSLDVDAQTYGSRYSVQQATPGYFTHQLDRYNIKTELSSTPRTGISRYTFPAGQSNILLNLGLALTNETGGMIRVVSPTKIEGFRTVGTFCYHAEDVRPVYFVAQFSKPAKSFGVFKKMPAYKDLEKDWVKYNDSYKLYENFQHQLAGDDIGAYFTYETTDQEQIMVKIGISYVSIENARENLMEEQLGFDFEKTRADNKKAWNEQLKKIEVKGTKEQKTIFYSALYHTLIHPSVFQDINGEYPLMDQYGFGKVKDRNRYTVYSLWDTYRNLNPLLSLVYPKKQSDVVNTMVDMYKESGWLPKWELLGMETEVMVGDPATPVITDTYLRGIRDFDVETAYEAIRKSATTSQKNNVLRPDVDAYHQLGYIPTESEEKWGGSVSTALEYYIADWNVARLAEALNKPEDVTLFHNRSLGYKHYYDDSTGMLRPKMASGEWHTPFDPEYGKNFEAVTGYVEGNAWQYRFYVPHDIPGLIQLVGGDQHFVNELEKTFATDNFSMHNEPDITYPYLFNYVKGEEWRSQKKVTELIKKYYKNAPDGIPGNDDTGTLSAWLVFSMMGIYPVCPGDMDYALVTPAFEEVIIHLDQHYYSGERIIIKNNKAGKIEKLQWNGKKHNRFFINHGQLTKGGTLEIN